MITAKKSCLLGDIASVHTGIYRKRVSGGEVYQIQKSDFGEAGELLELSQPPEFPREDRLESHYLMGGEILVTAKGDSNTAYVFPAIGKPAVASSVFLVLRLKRERISPSYLVWYLNTEHGQQQLAQRSRGSAVSSLTARDLKSLLIPIPTISMQNTILRLAELQARERELYESILAAKQRLHEATLLQLTNSSPKS